VLPSKKQLIKHLTDKMTNQNIAEIYGVSFQKIIQLTKQYKLDSNELRKVNHYVVYEHWYKGEVVYVGSGVWYRCRRYTNRRNEQHRELMKEGKITYRFVREFEDVVMAREFETSLIKKYKNMRQAEFNKHIKS
jgi:hypothetical protein